MPPWSLAPGPARSRSDEPIPVAVPEPIAGELGWSVGDVQELTDRRDESRTVRVRVAGIFSVDDLQRPLLVGPGPGRRSG